MDPVGATEQEGAAMPTAANLDVGVWVEHGIQEVELDHPFQQELWVVDEKRGQLSKSGILGLKQLPITKKNQQILAQKK